MPKQTRYVVSVIGEDRVGIVSEVTQFLFRRGFNIVDIEQSVIHSQFTMVLLIESLRSRVHLNQLKDGLNRLAKRLEMKITLTPLHQFRGLRFAETKRPYVLTILGTDRPGVVARFSSVLARHHSNIERIKMIARGEFLAMEVWVDLREANFPHLRSSLLREAKKIKMDIVIQPEHVFKKRKKVIVFDMDSTIVEGEIIDEMAKLAGVSKQVTSITEKGMEGKIDYVQSA